ncbi:Reverse transcriptase domain [Sesbania bispinosa]|nr:Reverse transcriptase domain [Sesbania bispinosa]
MGSFITSNQSAFVGGHLIQDNIIVAHEAFHALRKRTGCESKGAAVKLDMNKAYDRLEWGFLEQCLLAFGFSPMWVNWVMKLVSSVSYKFKVNDKVKAKLDGWKETLLNQWGKEVLIKAVIQAIPVYAMSIVKFPGTFCKKLGALVARFWWRRPKKDRGIHWKSWKLISRTKSEGGLEFKDFTLLNTALLAMQAWRIITNPNAYWLQILKAIYFPNSDFLICNDIWLSSGYSLAHLAPQVHDKVSDLIQPSRRAWDVSKIRANFQPHIAKKIFQTPISWSAEQNCLFWPHSSSGVFNVQSAYQRLKRKEDLNGPTPSSSSGGNREGHCRLYMPSVWFGSRNGGACTAYLWVDEASLAVWFATQIQIVPILQQITNVFSWLEEKIKSFHANINPVFSEIFISMWVIWKMRNEFIYKLTPINPLAAVYKIQILRSECVLAMSNLQNTVSINRNQPSTAKVWRPPPTGCLKCNTDACSLPEQRNWSYFNDYP